MVIFTAGRVWIMVHLPIFFAVFTLLLRLRKPDGWTNGSELVLKDRGNIDRYLTTTYKTFRWWRHEMETLDTFVRGIHRSPVDSLHNGPVIQALDISLMLSRTNCWANTLVAGDMRHRDAHGKPRWRHQMETFSALLALCSRNSPLTRALMFLWSAPERTVEKTIERLYNIG